MKLLFILPNILLVGFILWMNLTPGHFQEISYKSNDVGYITNDKVIKREVMVVNGQVMYTPSWYGNELTLETLSLKQYLLNQILPWFAWIDFYK